MDVRRFLSSGEWVRAQDLNRLGETAVVLNEGEPYTSEWGERFRILVELQVSKVQKFLTLNQVSFKELVGAWGDDSKAWIGKVITLQPVMQNVKGVMKNVVNVIPHVSPPKLGGLA